MDRRNWLEWTILVISVLAIVGVVGFLIADGLRDAGRPPQPLVELHRDQVYTTPAGWFLPATASNGGDQSAQSVVLLATATVDGAAEEAEVSIDYLPAGTDVNITFGFSAEPDGEIVVRVTGFVT